jgi:hypothetical protein
MFSVVIRNMKDIGVSDERVLPSFLEDGVNVFLKNLITIYPHYMLL